MLDRAVAVAVAIVCTTSPHIGCSRDDAVGAAPAFTTADSAGVEIVTIGAEAWPDATPWSLEGPPVLELGGNVDTELFRVRAGLRMDDGTIVIADGGSRQIRMFEADGSPGPVVGGEGDGPGEFRSLFGLGAIGDTLFAHDFINARVTRFTAAGEYIDDTALPRHGTSLPIRLFPTTDGYLLMYLGTLENIGENATYSRRPAIYAWCARDGSGLVEIATLNGQETVSTARSAGDNTTVMTMTTPLISHRQWEAVVNGRLVNAETDRFELNVYAPDRTLERLIRYPAREGRVTDVEWAAVQRQEVEDRGGTPEAERAVADLAEVAPRPAARPAMAGLAADPEGYVWIPQYRPEPGDSVAWLVVDLDGPALGPVRLPAGLRPLDIGPDWLLGLTADELDVPLVRLYHLRR